MNGGLNVNLVSKEQRQTGVLRQENESLKEKEREKEKEKEIAYLRNEYASLKSKNEELERRQLAKKIEQTSGMVNAKYIQKISIEESKNFELGLKRLNTDIQEAIGSNQQISLGSYITSKYGKLIPVMINVDFKNSRICMSLQEDMYVTTREEAAKAFSVCPSLI